MTTTTVIIIGCLSLILESLSQLFIIVDTQLLPMSSIHKPIAKLISVASRYDAINQSNSIIIRSTKHDDINNNNNDISKIESLKYKRRVGKYTYYIECSD